jgi:hypothetical protein
MILHTAQGLSAQDFDGADLEKVFSQCCHAVATVSDRRVMRVGKAIYEVQSGGSRTGSLGAAKG